MRKSRSSRSAGVIWKTRSRRRIRLRIPPRSRSHRRHPSLPRHGADLHSSSCSSSRCSFSAPRRPSSFRSEAGHVWMRRTSKGSQPPNRPTRIIGILRRYPERLSRLGRAARRARKRATVSRAIRSARVCDRSEIGSFLRWIPSETTSPPRMRKSRSSKRTLHV